jgi:hypothetical protein
MHHDLQAHPTNSVHSRASWFNRPSSVAVAMATLIVAFYLLREHWHHIAGYWAYLPLLACPLMHLFHGGHHGHGGHVRNQNESGNDRA